MKFVTSLSLIILFVCQLSAQQNPIRLSSIDKPEKLTGSDAGISHYSIKQKTTKEKDFTFTINPYLWTTAIGGSVQHTNSSPYYFNKTFSDAVKNMKMAAMIGGRVKYKSISLLYDIIYFNLESDISLPVYSGYVTGTSGFKQFSGDFSLGYRIPIKEKNIQIDFYGGTRVWSVESKLNLTGSEGHVYTSDQSKTWVDPIVGVGGLYIFSRKWFSVFKADIGGFGVSSDLTSTFAWTFGYNFSDHWNTMFGWKDLYIDYKDKLMWEVSLYGLVFSLGYKF
jgi:hypothetical protein